jgi:spore coat protein A
MEFRVKARVGPLDRFRPLVLPPLDPVSLLPVPNNAVYRDLTLNEGLDEFGRLFALIGTNIANPNPDFGYGYPYLEAGVGETMPAGTTEVWRIANLTGDTHPMHIHLQNALIVSRRPFDSANYNGTPVYTGPARGPDANERGWKETFRMNPGEVIEIIAKWDLAPMPAGFPELELSPRTGGHEYVWHCHILEHEEHDMMHSLVVT